MPNYNDPRYQTGVQQSYLGSRANQGAAALGQAQQAQRGALGLYQQAATGQAPSAAEAMMARERDRGIADTMALMAQGRGGNLGGTIAAANAAGQAQRQQSVQDMAALRAQEMEAARAGLAGISGQMAGQAGSQMMGYDQMGTSFMGQNLDRQQQDEQFDRQMRFNQQQANRNFGLQLGSQLAGGAFDMFGMGMMSDARLKTDVEDGGEEVREAVSKLVPVSWRYKEAKHGEGRFTGVMAQDLERSKAGKRIVKETPEGKAVSVAGMSALALAHAADVEKRLAALEGGKR